MFETIQKFVKYYANVHMPQFEDKNWGFVVWKAHEIQNANHWVTFKENNNYKEIGNSDTPEAQFGHKKETDLYPHCRLYQRRLWWEAKKSTWEQCAI